MPSKERNPNTSFVLLIKIASGICLLLQGVTLSDNIITDMGVNIGDYAPGANAWIYFDTVTPEMASNENIIYRNIIQACGGYGSKEKSADVIVDACEA